MFYCTGVKYVHTVLQTAIQYASAQEGGALTRHLDIWIRKVTTGRYN